MLVNDCSLAFISHVYYYYYFYIYIYIKLKVLNIAINWCILCHWCTEGKSSRSEASFRDCMTHIVLSL